MQRCLDLAANGLGYTAPNPLVGACLVHEGRIIGEGWHKAYGGPHAEVNAINNVPSQDIPLIPEATLYVNLEPCSHFGKTPPCASLIIEKKIKRVVIGMTDPNPKVSGKGIERLRNEGIEVVCGVMEEECRFLNRRFLHYITRQSPYIILKWAESADGFIAPSTKEKIQISGADAQRLLHRWRAEEQAIAVGAGTIKADKPQLTNRWWTGKSPIRIAFDRNLSEIEFYREHPFLVINDLRNETLSNGTECRVCAYEKNPQLLTKFLYEKGIQSLIIEGGKALLDFFIQHNLYEEIRIIKSLDCMLNEGLKAPMAPALNYTRITLMKDEILTAIK